MKVLVTGANGQLAWELRRLVSNKLPAAQGIDELRCLTREELDISNASAVSALLADYRPDAVINTAAYTAVDRAESDAEAAFQVNAAGVEHLAGACRDNSCYLLHISTDFVFDGESPRPYAVEAAREPLSVYGRTKAQGELALAATMENNWAIIRTAWVYSSHGANFVKSMLRLMAEKPALGIVVDQVGSPTWAKSLAEVCLRSVKARVQGIHHWTDAGIASWYDFAVAIQQLALEKGLLTQAIDIKPIPATAYPTPAVRPSFSVLDKTTTFEALPELAPVHWREQLSAMLDDYQQQAGNDE